MTCRLVKALLMAASGGLSLTGALHIRCFRDAAAALAAVTAADAGFGTLLRTGMSVEAACAAGLEAWQGWALTKQTTHQALERLPGSGACRALLAEVDVSLAGEGAGARPSGGRAAAVRSAADAEAAAKALLEVRVLYQGYIVSMFRTLEL